MKIAHIVCRFPPYYSGMGNVAFEMANAQIRMGHEVRVYTPQFEGPTEDDTTLATRLKPGFKYGNAAWMPGLAPELAQFDLVHLHYPFFGTANLVRRWKKKNPHIPLVVTYHMDNRAQGWLGLFFKYYAAFWLPKILGVADALHSASFDYLTASDAKKLYQAKPEQWFEVPFGVDTKRFVPNAKPVDWLAASGLNPHAPTILFVGGMDRAHFFKGVPVLLDALTMVKNGGLMVQALLVGDGDLRAEFEARALGLGIGDRVRFLGQVDDANLPAVYNAADLLVLPSTTRGEAFGMVVLEALASGVPVIATDLPGVRTLALEAGSVVEPRSAPDLADALYGYFARGNDQSGWGARARKVAEQKFDIDLVAKQMLNIYKKATTNAAARPEISKS